MGDVFCDVIYSSLGPEAPIRLADLEKRLPDMMRNAIRLDCRRTGRTEGDATLRILGAGWDDREQRISAFYVANRSAPDTPVEPFTLYEVPWIVTGDHPNGLTGLLGREVDPQDPAQFDPHADGKTLMLAQRKAAGITLHASIGHAVGGWCHLTTIDRESATAEALHYFPDRKGRRTDRQASADHPNDVATPSCRASSARFASTLRQTSALHLPAVP
ncbi:hypothetical protein J3E64_002684 [Sphingobium sp. OAS761]|uniref:hypothetical protein n=1 Tax=Sphingobium sp. OAS761 TaxID=2817901 RepID=UPI00209CB25B|nr:hypothetical protein [Sphingobium sp. OAS761]MCP1470987.1 hypothetical protein [Sphingobium sp. OAS761]